MELSKRQLQIIEIVKANQPISGESIASQLGLSRATLRNDLSILTMTGLLDARPKVGYFYTGQMVEPLIYDQLFKISVSDLMVQPLLISQEVSVYDAVTSLFMYDVGSLYVKNAAEELVGVVSRKDLLRSAVSNSNLERTPVAMIMSRMPNIITTTPEETILQAGNLLLQHQVDSLPVVASDNPKKVVGKLTKTRLMTYFIESGNHIKNESY